MPTRDFGRLDKMLRIGEGRRMKRLAQQAAYIAELEPDFQALSDDELRETTANLRERLENGESLDELCSRRTPPCARRWRCAAAAHVRRPDDGRDRPARG